METKNEMFIIDTDAGLDDAAAMILALSNPEKWKILGISVVAGNTSQKQALANVSRIKRLMNRIDIPVFGGADRPIICQESQFSHPEYHGKDGFGDVPTYAPEFRDPDLEPTENEYAAMALIRLCKQNPGAVTIICLGPLTNIALALKLDSQFSTSPKNVYIMGGSLWGIGNVHGKSTAEFNFFYDPEAAHIVLEEFKCPITLAPWDLYVMPQHETHVSADAHLLLNTYRSKFLKQITQQGREWLKRVNHDFTFCDEIACAAALNTKVIRSSKKVRASVELAGAKTRAQVTVEWSKAFKTGNPENVEFITQYDCALVENMMLKAVQ